mmetsp:Transcript_9493/g.9041  ORF Transcript_9493/g.9041 Transcript_9493/m.9041 type:complete len:203 (-) Transcript_9493:45-653(-)
MIEIYDWGKDSNKLRYIRSVPMKKDKDNNILKMRHILKRASFVTNGKLMLMINNRKMHFFDLATGIRLSKGLLKDDLKESPDGLVTYDIQNHRLWFLNRKDKELYSFICPNFKRVVKEESEFQVQYLKRRITAIRNKDLPMIKSVKDQQRDKVMATLGLAPIKSVVQGEGQQPFESASIDENKFLITSLLSESSATLERERP